METATQSCNSTCIILLQGILIESKDCSHAKFLQAFLVSSVITVGNWAFAMVTFESYNIKHTILASSLNLLVKECLKNVDLTIFVLDNYDAASLSQSAAFQLLTLVRVR